MTMQKLDFDDDANWETITGSDGKPKQVLRDHGAARVSMMELRMNDAATGTGLNKPGYGRRLTDAEIDIKQQSYDAYEHDLVNAWRDATPPGRNAKPEPTAAMTGAGSPGFVGAQEGDLCTCRNAQYPLDVGAPGHIRGGVCVPDSPTQSGDSRPRATSGLNVQSDHAKVAADHRRTMDQIYSGIERDLENAWRTP